LLVEALVVKDLGDVVIRLCEGYECLHTQMLHKN
jgi:hypothetical protein